ncbi:MAG: hypothetical protein DRP63_02055 [Planctomycetota bacterium]|nr:MAG: hypothetical protein DRP63_02055 [Planctomycetota bacterium]
MRYAFLLSVLLVGCGAGFKISTKSLPNAYLNEPYAAELKVTGVGKDEEGDLKWSCEGTLPEGVELSEHGVINGVPSEEGVFSFVVRVENEKSGDRAKRRFTLTVLGIEITSPASETIEMVYNEAQHIRFEAEHGKEPLSWEISEGALPSGVSFTSSGVLYGTPKKEGDFPVLVKVTDANGNTDERAYVICVTGAPTTLTIATLPVSPDNDGRVGLQYKFQFVATPAGQHRWSLAEGSQLPQGLTLEQESGLLHGTPEESGTFEFTVKVEDEVTGASGESTVSVTIHPMEIPLTQPEIIEGRVGAVYNAKLLIEGGFAPIKWSLTGTGLPPGLQLDDDGTIAGVPTQTGEFSFGVQAKDAKDNEAVATLTIKVSSDAPLTVLTRSSDIPQAQVGVEFGPFQLAATNYTGSLSWNCDEPPEGLHLTADGLLTGIPQKQGTYVLKVDVTDQGTGEVAEKYLAIEIKGLGDIGVSVSSGTISGDTVIVSSGVAVYVTFTVLEGGIPPVTWTADFAAIEGMNFSAQGYFHGTPATPGDYVVVVTATDGQSNARSKAFIIRVK